MYCRRDVRIVVPAVKLQTIDSIFVNALQELMEKVYLLATRVLRAVDFGSSLTCGGPRMVPFQSDIIMSLPSDRPYEQASIIVKIHQSVSYAGRLHKVCDQGSRNSPAPSPFSPFSSSSNRRKFRGTLAISMNSV